MTDWQIIDTDDFPESPDENASVITSRLDWRWISLFLGAVLLLVATGVFTLREQRTENQAALREDLAAHIFEEETHRFLGQSEPALIIPDAPSAWQEAYWRSFDTENEPKNIEITEIDFDGQCALVSLTLGPEKQTRGYCLGDRGWQRAPAPAWDQEQSVIRLEKNEIEIRFLPPDRAFAEALAADIPLFLEALTWRRLWPGALPYQEQTTQLEIILTPQDLHKPLILTDGSRIVLNSPQFTPTQETTGLSGETAVRLALAEALVGRITSSLSERDHPLPGAARFMAANQTVLAMHLALSPEARAAVLNHWRAQLDGRWVSPFYANLLQSQDPQNSSLDQQAALTARIMAHYIYTLEGQETLFSILEQLPVISSWDRLFQALLDRPTYIMERESAAYTQADLNSPALRYQLGDRLLPPRLPLTAALLRLENGYLRGSRAYVELSGRSLPVIVEMPAGMSFNTPSNTPLAPGCTGPGTRLEISGDWLEAGWRVQAVQINMQQVTPLTIEPAPADTMAYLLTGAPYDPQALLALKADGSLYSLVELNADLQVFPLPTLAGEKIHFLFKLKLSGCEGIWFVHYEPDQGVVEQWLAPPDPLQWAWRADQQDLIFFNDGPNHSVSDIYQTGDSFLPSFIDRSNIQQRVLGWNVKSKQVVSLISQPEGYYLGLYDIASGDLQRRTYYLPLRGRVLSPDGQWLAFLASSLNSVMPPNRLEVINLLDNSAKALMVLDVQEAFWSPVWSLNLAQPRLVALAGPVVDGQDPGLATRLLMASPEGTNEFQVIAEAVGDEQFASPIFCAGDALLYLVETNDSYQLRRQAPGKQAQTLATFDQPLHPLACP